MVRRKLRKLLADRDEGIAYDSENLTIGGYLDRWLDAVKGSWLSAPTLATGRRVESGG